MTGLVIGDGSALDYRDLAAKRGFVRPGANLPKNIGTHTEWRCDNGHRWQTTHGSVPGGGGCLRGTFIPIHAADR
jgi:hypothetical protein